MSDDNDDLSAFEDYDDEQGGPGTVLGELAGRTLGRVLYNQAMLTVVLRLQVRILAKLEDRTPEDVGKEADDLFEELLKEIAEPDRHWLE